MSPPPTPSQTIGPFFHRALLRGAASDLTDSQSAGLRIEIEGQILDGEHNPVSDAMVEIWQANAAGRYEHPDDPGPRLLDPHFHGFGRVGTDREGRFRFRTVKPGAVRDDGDFVQAPHINVLVFARGLLRHLATRIYFPGETLNEGDPVLSAVPQARRATLIAHEIDGAGGRRFGFDIILQGPQETVFFDV